MTGVIMFQHTDEDDTRLFVTRADGGLRVTATFAYHRVGFMSGDLHVAIDLPDADVDRLRKQLDAYRRPALDEMVDVVYGCTGDHVYYSTLCRHGNHKGCDATEHANGTPRNPGQCKECASACICTHHTAGAL